jgi:hypothetical protein
MAKKVRLYTLKFSSTFSKRGKMAKKYGYTLNFSSIFSHFFSFLEGENGKNVRLYTHIFVHFLIFEKRENWQKSMAIPPTFRPF